MRSTNKCLWISMILAAFMAAIALLSTPRVARADGPIYVDRDAPGPTHDGLSWATAYTNLQDGLDAAAPGDEVWVAEGVYVPTYQTDAGDGRTATFVLKNTVSLYGGFGGYGISGTLRIERDWEVHVTVLSGDLDGNDATDPNGVVTDTANITGTNAYHVVTGSGTDDTAVLDGFTITGGKADGSYPHILGGGMYNHYGAPTLSNVTFSGNHASSGGGMSNYGSPTLTNVTFSGNHARSGGGMYISWDSNPTLTNVTFSRNHAHYGGGIFNRSNLMLIDVTFSGNRVDEDGGGMYNDGDSDPTLINIAFSGNYSDGRGGGMCNHGNPTLINVTFSGNHAADFGGGMYNSGNPTLTNVTFSGNHAADFGGGMYNSGNPTLTNITFSGNHADYGGGGIAASGNPTLINCILWGNTASSDPQVAGSATISYSLVEGGYSGTVNLDAVPLFVDLNGADNITGTLDDDLRLLPASPAIDAGDNTAVPTDTLDLDGDGITTEPLPFDLDDNPRFDDMPSQPDVGNGTPPIVDMGAYETAPGLITVVKTADLGGATGAPLGGVVTYTQVIRNDGDDVVSGVVVTDPMPLGLTFGQWLERGSAQPPPPVTWGPFDVVARTSYALSFTANVTENTGFAGQVITNTAYFDTAGDVSGTSNPVVFTVTEPAVNRPPVADAGAGRTVSVNSTVTLDGSGSTDPDGDDLLYGWVQTGGALGVSFTPNVSVTTFTAPGSADVLTFALTVTDTGNLTDTATVVITVTEYSIYLPAVLRQHP
jgi:uncharacterized repeat protein (TIGR01451 family)